MTIAELLQLSRQQLADSSDSPALDGEVLLAHVLEKDRSHLRAWPEKEPTEAQQQAFMELLQQRQQGQPIAYLTGHREFWSLDLQITPDTLIPRPETELLVETLLELYPADKTISLADLGTGSGAIALAIASERPHWRIIATDIDADSLQLASQNARQHQLNNIDFRKGSWCLPLAELQLDAIVSNPPYIADTDPHLRQGDVRFEPARALSAGPDGLDDIRRLTSQANRHLKPGGLLMVEHGYQQPRQVMDIFIKNHYQHIQQRKDLLKQPRITYGYKPQ